MPGKRLRRGGEIASYAFTAAYRDMLTADSTGLASPTPPRRFLHCGNRGHHVGTGWFANATGSFKVERSFDFATDLTTVLRGDDLLARCQTRFRPALRDFKLTHVVQAAPVKAPPLPRFDYTNA